MRCDIHPPFYPYVVTRLAENEYAQEPLSTIFPEPQLHAIARRRAQESGRPTAIVLGPERAVFFEPDGESSVGTRPPWGGRLIMKSTIGDLELVDMSPAGGDTITSGHEIDFDPARLVARAMALRLWDAYRLECTLVASTCDPENPGIALVIRKPNGLDGDKLGAEMIAALPAEYGLLVRWEAVEVAGPAGPA